jgi:hypothetical protein
MTSRGPELDGFLDDFVTTPQDAEMLERIRAHDALDSFEYLRFLLAFTDAHPPTREIPERHEPFQL